MFLYKFKHFYLPLQLYSVRFFSLTMFSWCFLTEGQWSECCKARDRLLSTALHDASGNTCFINIHVVWSHSWHFITNLNSRLLELFIDFKFWSDIEISSSCCIKFGIITTDINWTLTMYTKSCVWQVKKVKENLRPWPCSPGTYQLARTMTPAHMEQLTYDNCSHLAPSLQSLKLPLLHSFKFNHSAFNIWVCHPILISAVN